MSFINIQRQHVIDTYEEAPLAARYAVVEKGLNEGLKIVDIHRRHPHLGSYKSVYEIAASIRSGRKIRPIQGADYLESRGLLPMDIHSDRLKLFNVLVAMNFWKGTRSGKDNSTGSYSAISAENPAEIEMITSVLSALRLDFETSAYHPRKGATTAHRVLYSMRAGRLVHLMGFEAGAKKQAPLPLPHYIQRAFETIGDMTADPSEKHVAFDVVHDFILTLLFFRRHMESSGALRLDLTPFESGAQANAQATAIRNMMSCVLPTAQVDFRPAERSIKKGSVFVVRGTLQNPSADQICAAYDKRLKTLKTTPLPLSRAS